MSLLIEMERKGVGRIRVRSGTTKRRVYDAMLQMLATLYEIGRADLLRDVKEGRVNVMALYEKYRTGKLEELPTGDLMRPLKAAWDEWMAGKEISELTRHDYEQAWARLGATGSTTMPELAALLKAHRKASMGVRARSFNKDRSAVLTFLNATLGDTHWLHQACRRVATLKVPKERKMPYNPQSVTQVKALAAKMKPHHALTLWAFCLTGMRPEEMFEQRGNSWEALDELVRIKGTKSAAAERAVPRVGLIVKPQTGRLAFYRALREASGKTVTPYDLRRTYHQWLDLAKIPAFRQSFYVGHGPKNLDELYKRMRECLPSMREDAAALGVLVGQTPGLRVVS